MYNGPSQVYCIKPEGRIHWYTKWLSTQQSGKTCLRVVDLIRFECGAFLPSDDDR